MNVPEIFETLDYGPAPESAAEAMAWLDGRPTWVIAVGYSGSVALGVASTVVARANRGVRGRHD